VAARRLGFVVQAPWVAVFFELADDVFGNRVAFGFLSVLAACRARDLAGADQGAGDGIFEEGAMRTA
jgi:hypothetical protein